MIWLKVMVGICACIAVCGFVLSIRDIKNQVPDENRKYMDPLPKKLRLIWPLVNVFTFYVGDRVSVDTLEKQYRNLRRSGVAYLMTPEQYIGLRCTSAFLSLIAAIVFMLLLGHFNYWYCLAAIVVGYFLPASTMRDMKAKREKSIVKALPTFLDYLTMAVQAGMNMTGALQQAVEKGPDGPLKTEFSKVIRDIRAGSPRVDAIRAMADRLEIREVNAFSTAVVQAEKTGASIGDSLKIQADQRRIERFQKAEKLAMEAPVKLIFPLVAFIFPMTFMILLFPIAMKFLYEL